MRLRCVPGERGTPLGDFEGSAESGQAGIDCGRPQFFLDPEKTVVFGGAFASAGSACFDLAGVESDGKVGDGGVLRFAGAVGGNSRVARLMRHADGVQRFGDGADLVKLDENGVAAAEINAPAQTLGVRYKEIVADELHRAAKLLRHELPAFPVLFVKAVLNGTNRIFGAQLLPMPYKLLGRKFLLAFGKHILALFRTLPFACGSVDGQYKVASRLVPCFRNGLEKVADGVLVAGEIRCETAFIADGGCQIL